MPGLRFDAHLLSCTLSAPSGEEDEQRRKCQRLDVHPQIPGSAGKLHHDDGDSAADQRNQAYHMPTSKQAVLPHEESLVCQEKHRVRRQSWPGLEDELQFLFFSHFLCFACLSSRSLSLHASFAPIPSPKRKQNVCTFD